MRDAQIISKKGILYMNNKVLVTGINTSQLKTLSDTEARALMERVKAGDRAAREEFITSNLKLVLSEVSKIKKRGDNSDDLFQIGCVGLIKAVDNFDVSQNVRFSTYAVPAKVIT
jgi:RNA polymerase sporulation-specific sigma factor